ncbi:MAG: 5'/3'-nucleotidase SurE [Acidobacteria bacterium]|nr:5'/3'-nucleotidase SurE [Acidobacteriota bacterium]MCI0620167.1 5'/3'-nucleotidase SurE [Acidobacteriota bacterium]MCI0718189.1 5'/3'-nucleotidase SurE [Acidobacteriota bacterium]
MAEILLTNDDGVHSPGILILAEALSRLGRVTAVAPDRERSATSQSLTLHDPIRCEAVADGRYSVSGTPTDCVILAIHHLLPARPDLVVSGINRGPNLGKDIGYSGTVAGAVEGANHDIPSFAISLAAWSEFRFEPAAQFAASLAEKILEAPLPQGSILNVNVPPTFKGVRITCQGKRNIRNLIVESKDPRGRKYFWLDQDLNLPGTEENPASDYLAVAEGYVSLTPLRIDRTNYDLAELMANWPASLFKEAIPLTQ